jgi:hypothetical protein
MTTFLSRIVGAALLDSRTYEAVEADRRATVQAGAVVLLSSLAAGIGAAGGFGRPLALAGFSAVALTSWILWAVLILQVGARILPAPRTEVDLGQLVRTIGFASAPGMIRVFAVIPGTRSLLIGVTTVWMLMAMVVAVRQALDYTSTLRALAVCAMALALTAAFVLGIGMLFAPAVY